VRKATNTPMAPPRSLLRTCVLVPAEPTPENRRATLATGWTAMAADFLKFRIFLLGGCFSENTKNIPKAITTNSVSFRAREEMRDEGRRRARQGGNQPDQGMRRRGQAGGYLGCLASSTILDAKVESALF